jgi:lysozyme family protein
MQDVEQIAEQIVAREGGYANDPDGLGGATNHGEKIHTMRRLGLDLDLDGQVAEQDVRVLTKDQAVAIFIDHYFDRPRIADLPSVLHATVFDMYVNAGANAVRILQRLLLDMRIEVTVDVLIGPQTIQSTGQGMAAAPDHFVNAYGIARRNYYYALADGRPASRKYARRLDGGKGGCVTRVEEFISAHYHLTAAQHRERTSKWV